jgi:hypothetical protein
MGDGSVLSLGISPLYKESGPPETLSCTPESKKREETAFLLEYDPDIYMKNTIPY